MLIDQKPSYRNITIQDYEAMAGSSWPAYADFAAGGQIEQFVADEIDSMLKHTEEALSNLEHFCVAPFYGMEYPDNTHCCLLPRGHDIEKIRHNMLNNQRAPECRKCWIIEDAGALSERQIKNQTLDAYANIDIGYLYEQARQGKNVTNYYKIAASNYCNSTCITCGPAGSSAWADLLSTDRPVSRLSSDHESIQFDYAIAKFLSFTGGESTMIRSHWDILERLVEAGNVDCCISFVTNGSFNLTARQQQILSQFNNVVFCFSIDGIGPVFEYLRYPLSWNKTVDNIQWVRDQGHSVSASYTISNLNILYHDQTVQWFEDNLINYLENPVYGPAHFAPQALSSEIKQRILQQTQHSTVHALLQSHTVEHEKQYAEFRKQIESQDQLKGISIQQYLPELVDLF